MAIPGGDEGGSKWLRTQQKTAIQIERAEARPRFYNLYWDLYEESRELRQHPLEPLVLRNILLIPLDIWKKLAGG